MEGGVLELVLLLTVKHHTVVIHEVKDASLPEGARHELHDEVVFPFLTRQAGTFSVSSAEDCFFLGFSGFSSSLLRPKSHSNINHR